MKFYFLTFDGRIGRRTYWIGAAWLLLAALVAMFSIGVAEGVLTPGQGASRWGTIGIFLVTLVLMLPSYSLAIRRTNDLDYPAWTAWAITGLSVVDSARSLGGWGYADNALTMIFGVLFALAFLWAVVVLGFRRGTVGANRHGPDPVADAAPAVA